MNGQLQKVYIALRLGDNEGNIWHAALLVSGPPVPAVDQFIVLVEFDGRQDGKIFRVFLYSYSACLDSWIQVAAENNIRNGNLLQQDGSLSVWF
ncbi:MAG: hypothetical protein ABIG63_17570 [Chloroflexota bacterium]